MNKREFLRMVITQYFIVVTLINIVMFVLGMIYRPDELFGYKAFLTPLIYAAYTMIPVVLSYSSKELSFRQMLIRKMLVFLAVEAIMLGIGLAGSLFFWDQPLVMISFALAIFMIFIIVLIISWILDLGQARQMNIDLENYKKRMIE